MPAAPPHHRRLRKIQDTCFEGRPPRCKHGPPLTRIQVKVNPSSVTSDDRISCHSRHVAEGPSLARLTRERVCDGQGSRGEPAGRCWAVWSQDTGGGVTRASAQPPGAGGAAARQPESLCPWLLGEENATSGWFPPGAQGRLT